MKAWKITRLHPACVNSQGLKLQSRICFKCKYWVCLAFTVRGKRGLLDLWEWWWDHDCHKGYYPDETITQSACWKPVWTCWLWLVLPCYWKTWNLFIYYSQIHSSCDIVQSLFFIFSVPAASAELHSYSNCALSMAYITGMLVRQTSCSLGIPFTFYAITLGWSVRAANDT